MTIATARFEARLTPDTHALLKQAAELQGRTLSDFVISAARQAAQQTIAEQQILNLSLADQACFAEALASPPGPNAAMRRAKMRHAALFAQE